MYSVAPAAKAAWRELLEWILEHANLRMEFVDQEPPATLADLWARSDLGCAMMCGLPYSHRKPRPILLAAPVPSPERYADRAVYFTDIAVRADSPFVKIEDTFGHVVGWRYVGTCCRFARPANRSIAKWSASSSTRAASSRP